MSALGINGTVFAYLVDSLDLSHILDLTGIMASMLF